MVKANSAAPRPDKLRAYNYFAAENRGPVRDLNPDESVQDIEKVLGALWKTMSQDQKAPFFKKAEDENREVAKKKEKGAEEKMLCFVVVAVFVVVALVVGMIWGFVI